MGLDGDRGLGERQHLLVADAKALLLGFRGRDIVRGGAPGASRIDHLDLLGAQRAAQHCPLVTLEGWLEHIEFVGVDRPLHHILAEAIGAGDEHHVAETGFRVEGEHHATRRQVGAHHFHDAHRKKHLEVVKAVVDPVVDRPIHEQAGKAAPHGVEQLRFTGDVQIGLVLAGEARRRQILGGGRTAYRDGEMPAVLAL